MSYNIFEFEVEASYLVAVRATVTHQNLGPTIRKILGESQVYKFIAEAGLQKVGHNVMVYKNDLGKRTGLGLIEFELEVGVQVAGPFEGNDKVVCSTTPAGKTLSTVHTGPYDKLGLAHDAIMSWAREHSLPFTGRSWEVYGDFHPDPAQTTTQVFYLLK